MKAQLVLSLLALGLIVVLAVGPTLAQLASVPIRTRNYKSQAPSVRHTGPTAHSFYAAFGVGENNTHISTLGADGVALAAVRGLYAENQA
jgi:hypothetical protein